MAALHEVRNPLNGIVLTLEYIDDSLSDQIGGEELREELRTIRTCAGHQTLLLKSIMDLDKIVAGQKELPREDFNPAKICRDALAMNKHAAKPGVTASVTVAPEADKVFAGAPTQLNLVLVNLVSNALKFTTEGKVVLSVAVEDAGGGEEGLSEETAKTTTLRFAVTDTGPGVPLSQQESIFGLRGQAGNETSKAKGFGFGLFVAHELVERMGGKIELQSPTESPVGEVKGGGGSIGSMFSFEVRVGDNSNSKFSPSPSSHSAALGDRLKLRLHLECAGAGQQHLVVPKEEEEAEKDWFDEVLTMKGWKVLLADDSDLNLRLLARKFTAGPFEKLGWTVETATTGEKALAKISETSSRADGERFDLVVFDENMQPEGLLLGTEATRTLRKEDNRVLIIGCTGNSTDDDIATSKESGQDLFWSKPAPPSEEALDDLVGALVRRRRNQSRPREEEETHGEMKARRQRVVTVPDKESGKYAYEESEARLPGLPGSVNP